MSLPIEGEPLDLAAFHKRVFDLIRTTDATSITTVQTALIDSQSQLLNPGNNSRITEFVDFESVELVRPSWLDVSGLVTQLRGLNHPTVWRAIFESVGQTGDELFATESHRHYSQRINLSNRIFFEVATTLFGLAAVLGNEYKSVLTFNETYWDGGIEASLQAGRTFTTPAQSPDEATDRIGGIFVPPPGRRFSLAYEALTSVNAFQRDPEENTKICPAPQLTMKVYQAFGDLLQTNPDYRSQFQTGITQI